MALNRTLATLAFSFLAGLMFCSASAAAEYQHTLAVDDMTFAWSVNGDKLDVKIAAPTKGWVGIGFNPSSRMKDANIIVGYVKDGKVKVEDEFGTAATMHKTDDKIGGADHVTVIGGSEDDSSTTIEFSIPMNSGDEKDGVIDPAADTVVMLAYGPDRDSLRLKHAAHQTFTVNLSTGEKK